MKIFNALRIQCEIEGLRRSIVAQLATDEPALSEEIQRALVAAVEDIDVTALVKKHTKPILESTVRRAVESACSRLAWDPEFSGVIHEQVRIALAKEARERPGL